MVRTIRMAWLVAAALLAAAAGATAGDAAYVNETCLAWGESHAESMIKLAQALRDEQGLSAEGVIGGDNWPPTAGQKAALASDGFQACFAALPPLLQRDHPEHEQCHADVLEYALAMASLTVFMNTALEAKGAGGQVSLDGITGTPAEQAATHYARDYPLCLETRSEG